MKTKDKRRICFPITSRVHYARQKKLLSLIKHNPKMELQLVVGGSVLLDKYGERFLPAITAAGFNVNESLFNVIEGGSHIAMAKTAGLTALEFSNSIHKLNPDIVLIRGDRFEQLAMAMVAAYLNKTIAHIEGGDVTGTIDESVRHAITKLAHIHFVTNEDSKKRVVQMGENPKFVFNVGSLDVEFAASVKKKLDKNFFNMHGIGAGASVDLDNPFLVVMYHPVTTEDNNRSNVEMLLEVIDSINMPVVWFWPNSDAGTTEISKALRMYREQNRLKNDKIRFVTDLLPDDFIALLKRAKVFVGNSSAGIKESSYLGVPVVNIGSRQNGRLRGPNVLDAENNPREIAYAIQRQLGCERHVPSNVYYKLNTSQRVAGILANTKLYSQKKFYDA